MLVVGVCSGRFCAARVVLGCVLLGCARCALGGLGLRVVGGLLLRWLLFPTRGCKSTWPMMASFALVTLGVVPREGL